MHNRETLFYLILNYHVIRNFSFQENAKTKLYALEDSLGVCVLHRGGGGGGDIKG